MKDSDQKVQAKVKSGFSPLVAAVSGLIVGAAAAIAGVLAFKDKNNGEKVKRSLNDLKDQAKDYVKDVKNEVEVKITKGLDKAKRAVNSAKDSLDQDENNA